MAKKSYTIITDVNALPETLFREESVILKGVGRFEIRHIPERTFFSGISKKVVTSSARKHIRFVPYKKIRDLCKK
jgi:nucleoid DNA-binding protein